MGARLKFWRRSRVPEKGSRDEAVGISCGVAARDGSATTSHNQDSFSKQDREPWKGFVLKWDGDIGTRVWGLGTRRRETRDLGTSSVVRGDVNATHPTLFMVPIGTLRNYDGDGKENVKIAIGLMSKTTTLHVHHAFLYISLLSLHNYDVK